MPEFVRFPSSRKSVWQILELVAALRLLDSSSLPAAIAALQQRLRSNVLQHYGLYGALDICHYAYLLQLYEPGCREFAWLVQTAEAPADDVLLDLVLIGEGRPVH